MTRRDAGTFELEENRPVEVSAGTIARGLVFLLALAAVATAVSLSWGGDKDENNAVPSTGPVSGDAQPAGATSTAAPSLPKGPVVPGITVTDVYFDLKARGWDCDGPNAYDTMEGVDYLCESGLNTATVYGYSLNEFVGLDATAPTKDGRNALLYLASIPYDGANAKENRDWVNQHLADGTPGQSMTVRRSANIPFTITYGVNGEYRGLSIGYSTASLSLNRDERVSSFGRGAREFTGPMNQSPDPNYFSP